MNRFFFNISSAVTFKLLLYGNESENPFLIPNFTKYVFFFLRKWQKTTFLVKLFCDKLTKIALS